MSLIRRRSLLALAVILAGALVPTPAAAAGNVSVVTTGLDSPRGITFWGEHLYVAEAGHGNGTPGSIGATSRISRVNTNTGTHTPFVSGLFSIKLGDVEAVGASGLTVSEETLYAIMAENSRAPGQNTQLALAQAGHLLAFHHNGSMTDVASVGNSDYDFTKTLSPSLNQEIDANPNDVKAFGDDFFVADSGSNTLTLVSEERPFVLKHFPARYGDASFPSDEVPTCVAMSWGTLYVGTLAGHLFKMNAFGFGDATPVIPKDAGGNDLLTHVTGCTNDRWGNLYLVNMFGGGAPFSPPFFVGNVVKFNPMSGQGSVLASSGTPGNGALLLPYMPTLGKDGNLYVTAGAICAADGSTQLPSCNTGGRVVKIALS